MTPPVAGLDTFAATVARLDAVGCDGAVTANLQRLADTYRVNVVAEEWAISITEHPVAEQVASVLASLPPAAQNVQVLFSRAGGVRRLVVRSYLPVR